MSQDAERGPKGGVEWRSPRRWSLRRPFLAVALGFAALAQAEPKRLVVSAGDCHDAELVTGMAEFQKAMRAVPKNDVYDPELVLDIIRPRSTRSLDDVKRQVDSARTLFYGGQSDRALELIRQALAELERASPEVKPWPVSAEALVLQATILRQANRKQDSADAFRRVLRIEPGYALDPDSVPPSTIQAFEALRKELTRAKKATLQVQANLSSEVFLDGRAVGKTPLKLEVLPGTYRLSLLAGEQLSFARLVEVSRSEQVQVDLAFEGAVSTRAPLCLSLAGDKPQQDAALKLAATVNAEEIVIFRVDSARGDPAYYHAYLWRVAPVDRVRDAAVKFEQLSDLAWFIATGKPIPSEPKKVAKTDAPKPDAPKLEVLPPPPPPPMLSAQGGPSGARVTSYVLMAGGGAAILGGAAVYLAGGGDREHLATLYASDGKLYSPADPRHREALDLMPKVDANTTIAFTLIGVGAGAAAAGLATFFLFPPDSKVTVSAAPSPDGAAVTVQGRF